MKHFWKATNWVIALTATVVVGLTGVLARPGLSWDMLRQPDVVAPDSVTQPEQIPMGEMQAPHQDIPMQMSGEILELMGEMQKLMATLTPEQMAEFRPYMVEHHEHMVEEMQAVVDQLREITGSAAGANTIR